MEGLTNVGTFGSPLEGLICTRFLVEERRDFMLGAVEVEETNLLGFDFTFPLNNSKKELSFKLPESKRSSRLSIESSRFGPAIL